MQWQTERTKITLLTNNDTAFIIKLLNQPSFIENIGDKNVRTQEDAIAYIHEGPLTCFKTNGFCLNKVSLLDGTPIGICGLLKRPSLSLPDIGFAFLPEFCDQGFATESALECIKQAKDSLNIHQFAGITSPTNIGSQRVLEKLGLKYIKDIELPLIAGVSRYYCN